MVRTLGATQRLRERARANHEADMPDTAAIYRPSATTPSNDFGSNTVYALLDTVPANYWAVTGQEALTLQRLDVRANSTVMLPALTDITEHDQIVYTVTETGAIHHFDVSYVHDRSRGHTLHVSVTEYKFDAH